MWGGSNNPHAPIPGVPKESAKAQDPCRHVEVPARPEDQPWAFDLGFFVQFSQGDDLNHLHHVHKGPGQL